MTSALVYLWLGWAVCTLAGLGVAAVSAFAIVFDNGVSGVRRAHPIGWALIVLGLVAFIYGVRNLPLGMLR